MVGVIADVKHTDVSLGPDTELLLAFPQFPMTAMTLAVRLDPGIHSEPMRFAPLLRRAVAAVDRNVPLFRLSTMERTMDDRLGPRRLDVILLGLFSVLALLLSALGIYGVLSHAVARRTHEIGVRVALGAGHRAVVWLVVRQAMALVLVGLGAGTVASLALGRWVRALLFGVTATDPWGFVASALLLAAVAAAAAWVPACRAVLVDPCEALRAE